MFRIFLAAAALLTAGSATATTIVFNTDPFAGSTALTTPGRQVVGNELFLPTFSLNDDVFSFDGSVFGVGTVTFATDVAANLPTSGLTVIVLQDTDNDNNAGTPFGAGNAANLIADRVTQSGPGFFIYMNSGLNLRRLVFSTDLSDNTADLKILARILDPTGAAAISTLPNFTAGNFNATPEPSSFALLGLGLVFGTAAWRRRTAGRR